MTLKEFRSILLGQDIIIYTNHKNLESDLAHLTSQMELRQHLLIEECGIKIIYIKGEKNNVVDTLSYLNFASSKSNAFAMTKYVFSLQGSDTEIFSLSMS